MKKNKIAALALSGALLVGATALGTFAYFNDTEKVDTNISITTGTLGLEVEGDTGWVVKPQSEGENGVSGSNLNTEAKEGEIDGQFTNARPGDVFTKNLTIKYKGSLDAKILAKVNNTASQTIDVTVGNETKQVSVNKIFEVAVSTGNMEQPKEFNENGILIKQKVSDGAEMPVNIELKLRKDVGNEYQNAKFDFNQLNDISFIEVEAMQLNGPNLK